MTQDRAARLSLEQLSLARGGRRVVDGLSGSFLAGHITAIIGANGAGKSTLVSSIMGELSPIAGHIHCNVPREQRAWLPQQLALDLSFPMSVEELIMTGCWPTHGALRGYCSRCYGRGRDIMERLGISHLAHRPLGELSGGQRQRVLLGRTLMQNARLLILDEPFANIDAATVDVLTTVLRSMAAEGVTILVVLHDQVQLAELADRVLMLSQGKGYWYSSEHILQVINATPGMPLPTHPLAADPLAVNPQETAL